MIRIRYKLERCYWKLNEKMFKSETAKTNFSISESQEWASLPINKLSIWFSATSAYSSRCLSKLAKQLLRQLKFAHSELGLVYGSININNVMAIVPLPLVNLTRKYVELLKYP